MADEMVLVVDEEDNVVSKEMKSVCHQKGLLHRVSACLIFNSKGELWLQKRAKGKIGEGLLDFSASGHVGLNESYDEAAYKELGEELGVRTELKLLFNNISEKFHDKIGIVRHLINVYIGFHDGPFSIQEEELEEVSAYSLDLVKKMLKKHPENMTQGLMKGLIRYLKEDIKNFFPIFNHNPNLIYLDSAATSQKPKQVINAITNFYEKENANIHRGIYNLSEQATTKYNEAREKIAEFINANENEVIFTKGTTESFNLLATTIKPLISKDKNEIVLTEMEHHSNLVPWQEFAKKNKFTLKFIPITKEYILDYKKAKELINEKTALVSVTHISNVFGTINDIKKIITLAKENNALTIIDSAQSILHKEIDVEDLDCDFLAFSGHKMYGPTGIGVLYGRKELLEKLNPYQFGGGMINNVSYEKSTFKDLPEKFEAGTPNIIGAIALAKAVDFINETSFEKIKEHEKELLDYAIKELKNLDNIELYAPTSENHSSIISFNIKNIHPHDVAEILNNNNIAIRAGHHCCMPLIKKLNLSGTCRISFAVYNTKEDIDKLVAGLKKVLEVFN